MTWIAEILHLYIKEDFSISLVSVMMLNYNNAYYIPVMFLSVLKKTKKNKKKTLKLKIKNMELCSLVLFS